MKQTPAHRHKAWVFGSRAETIAAWILRFKGYRILAHRYKTPRGEIDIIAKRGQTLVFVEVKARARINPDHPIVLNRQFKRIAASAEVFISKWKGAAPKSIRFDVIVIQTRHMPKHLKEVWRPS